MRLALLIIAALCLAVTVGIGALHENVGPGGTDGKPIVIKAPSGQYRLVQAPADPPLESCDVKGGWPCYQTTVHFRDKSKPDQVLPPVGLARQAAYQAPANYVISPDERWFVRDQHLFAGCNILALYKVESDGKVHEDQSDLVDLGIKCILPDVHRAKKEWADLKPDEFFHFSGENVKWNRASNVVRYEIFARPDPPAPSIRESVVGYDVKKRTITHEKIFLGDSRTGEEIQTLPSSSMVH
jgi:hypothetical protein